MKIVDGSIVLIMFRSSLLSCCTRCIHVVSLWKKNVLMLDLCSELMSGILFAVLSVMQPVQGGSKFYIL